MNALIYEFLGTGTGEVPTSLSILKHFAILNYNFIRVIADYRTIRKLLEEGPKDFYYSKENNILIHVGYYT